MRLRRAPIKNIAPPPAEGRVCVRVTRAGLLNLYIIRKTGMKLKRTRTHSIVKDYETIQKFLSDMGYDISKLKLEPLVKIKLAIQDVIDEINL